MKNLPLLALLPFLLFLAACSSGYTEPPVSANKAVKKAAPKKSVAQKPQTGQGQSKKPASNGMATYAIDNSPGNFKDEPSLPAFRAEPLTAPADAPAAQPPQTTGIATAPAPAEQPPAPAPTAPAPIQTPAVAAPMPVPIVMEDAAIPSGTSPAVMALVSEADRSRSHGDLDAAVTVMERALRIDSRNPTVTYKLAQIRLKQSKPQLAEELAGKAALLAGSNLDLKRKSWLLIAESRQMQQNYQGAKEAKAKAESFFGR